MRATAERFEPREVTPADTFQTISPGSWQGREPPRRDWMVERCFVRGSVGMLSGDGGIGKSLLMQQLCTCAVLGRAFLGLTLSPGRALFFGCEDDHDELWRRQRAINRLIGCEMADLGDAGLELAPRVGQENALSRLDRKEWRMMPTDLFTRLAARAIDLGVSYVVIDTATQTFAGNQNDEQQVVQFCNQLRRLAVMIQGVVIITKHPSAAGRALETGESGSVSWNNSVRSRLYLRKDKTRGLLLSMKKNNYGKADLELGLRWDRGAYVVDQPEIPDMSARYGD